MFCETCGKEIIKGYSFCMGCGSPVPAGAFDEESKPAEDNSIPDIGKKGGIAPEGEKRSSGSSVPLFNTMNTGLDGGLGLGLDDSVVNLFGPAALGVGSIGDFGSTSSNIDMPSIEAPARTSQAKQKEPEKGMERTMDDFSMADDVGDATLEVTDRAVKILGGTSMDENVGADIDLSPYKFLDNQIDIAEEPAEPEPVAVAEPEPVAVAVAVEEAPAAEAPVEEAPAEEAPAEEAPTEEAPAEETPAEETPAAETPAEEAPAAEAAAEEAPAAETTAEEAPAAEAAAEEAPAEEKPSEEAPAAETTAEETPVEEKPSEETPAEVAPPAEETVPAMPEDDFIPEEMSVIEEVSADAVAEAPKSEGMPEPLVLTAPRRPEPPKAAPTGHPTKSARYCKNCGFDLGPRDKKCSNCGAEAPEPVAPLMSPGHPQKSARYCKNCGWDLGEHETKCPNCAAKCPVTTVSSATKQRYCRTCGQDLKPSESVCKNCGAPYKGAYVPPKHKEVAQKKSTEPIKLFGVIPLSAVIGVASIAVLVLALGIYIAVGNSRNKIPVDSDPVSVPIGSSSTTTVSSSESKPEESTTSSSVTSTDPVESSTSTTTSSEPVSTSSTPQSSSSKPQSSSSKPQSSSSKPQSSSSVTPTDPTKMTQAASECEAGRLKLVEASLTIAGEMGKMQTYTQMIARADAIGEELPLSLKSAMINSITRGKSSVDAAIGSAGSVNASLVPCKNAVQNLKSKYDAYYEYMKNTPAINVATAYNYYVACEQALKSVADIQYTSAYTANDKKLAAQAMATSSQTYVKSANSGLRTMRDNISRTSLNGLESAYSAISSNSTTFCKAVSDVYKVKAYVLFTGNNTTVKSNYDDLYSKITVYVNIDKYIGKYDSYYDSCY